MHLKRLAGTNERRLLTEADAEKNAEAWQRHHLEAETIGPSQDGL
jgi:hypothetical protein